MTMNTSPYGHQDLSKWSDVLSRIRSADEGCADLDDAIWAILSGFDYPLSKTAIEGRNKARSDLSSHPEIMATRSVDAALGVMDRLLPGCYLTISRATNINPSSVVDIHGASNGNSYSGQSEVAGNGKTAIAITMLAIGLRLQIDNPDFLFDPDLALTSHGLMDIQSPSGF